MTPESAILRAVHAALGSRADARVWRVNVGKAYPLGPVRALMSAVARGDLTLARARAAELRPIAYGLPGQADLMGVVAPSGRLLSVECKSETGRASPEQRAWAAMVRKFGGIALEDVRSAEQAVAEMEAML